MRSFLDSRRRSDLLSNHPIPAITDPAVERAVRTRSRPLHLSRFPSLPHSPDNVQFELLESLGDCVVVTSLGKAIFAHLNRSEEHASAGLFACYRNLLQSNYAFAQLAFAYDLSSRLTPPIFATFDDRDKLSSNAVKALGDAFEAYVGGLSASGKAAEAEEWLGKLFPVLCSWVQEMATAATAATEPPRVTRGAERLDTFASRRASIDNPPVTQHACGCYKRALSLCVKEQGIRYDVVVESPYIARLSFTNGLTFEATASSKKEAENDAAAAALRALDPGALMRIEHQCKSAGAAKDEKVVGVKRPRES